MVMQPFTSQGKNKLFLRILLAAFLMPAGCATPNFKPAANVPADKAMIYLYREQNYLGSGVSYKIFANQHPVTLLTASGIFTDNNYYPYLAAPGEISFTGKQVSNGETHLFDFMVPKCKLATIEVEAGKTYYLKFKWKYVGVTYWPSLVLQDNEAAACEITNCVLAQCLETNLATR
jgi:hypothetical protein